jgi:hypothetical protein
MKAPPLMNFDIEDNSNRFGDALNYFFIGREIRQRPGKTGKPRA